MTTQAERVMAVEVRVQNLEKKVDDLKSTAEADFKEVNEKLDNLLALKHKGGGVFWLASILFGTSIIGSFISLMDWFKGS